MTDITYFQFMERIHRATTTAALSAIAIELKQDHADDPRRPDIGEAIAQRRLVISVLARKD